MLGGVQIATAVEVGQRRIGFGGSGEGRNAFDLRPLLADDAGQAEKRMIGDDRQVLVARDLADADDRDRIRRHDRHSDALGGQ